MLRRRFKRATEWVLANMGPAHAARIAMRDRTVVLAYHNIVPVGAQPGSDRSLHLPVDQFRRQLDFLARTHDVVALPDLLGRGRSSTARPRAVITFDDAYQGAVMHGVEELARRGLPATIFVAPAFLGGSSFWWDSLYDRTGDDRDRFRRFALDQLRGSDSAIRAWASRMDISETPVPEYALAATEDELVEAMRFEGLTLGSHTWSHPNLVRLSEEELRKELSLPLEWLQHRFARVIPWLAYPYGLASPQVERAARDAGYAGALRVTGGSTRSPALQRFRLPRLNIAAGLSLEGFALQTAGLT